MHPLVVDKGLNEDHFVHEKSEYEEVVEYQLANE